METGKAVKTAAIYAIPWMAISLLLGFILGMFVFPFIDPVISSTGFGWIISGFISAFVVWFVWLKFEIPEQYLNKYV